MKIKIGEAAQCETHQGGYETGHQMGNQTGSELRIVDYRNHPWTYCFRWKNRDYARAAAIRQMQACQNMLIGYGRPKRKSYMEQLLKPEVAYDPSKITELCDCDCSSLTNGNVYVTLLSQGKKSSITGYEVTAGMYSHYKNNPYFEDVTASINFATGDGVQLGDVLWKPSSHTAMVVSVEEDYKKGTVKTKLYLRKEKFDSAGHYVKGAAICAMPKGSEITILGEVYTSTGAKWYKAKYEDKTGYCSAAYITIK